MSAETIALIMTTLAGVTAAVKAVAEARKARFEAEKALVEKERADEAEKTTDAVIRGVENAKRTLGEVSLAQHLQNEIQNVAKECGIEEKLNKRVKSIKKTIQFDRSKLLDRLDE